MKRIALPALAAALSMALALTLLRGRAETVSIREDSDVWGAFAPYLAREAARFLGAERVTRDAWRYVQWEERFLRERSQASAAVGNAWVSVEAPLTTLNADRVQKIFGGFALVKHLAAEDGVSTPEELYHFLRAGWPRRRSEQWLDENDAKMIAAHDQLLGLVGRFTCTGGGRD